MSAVTKPTQLLREVATAALQAGRWLECYEASGKPEYRLKAIRCLMDARDTLARVEVSVTDGLTRDADRPVQT